MMEDPIYAQIETRKRLLEAADAACMALDEYEVGNRRPDGRLPIGDEAWCVLEKENERTCLADHQALLALLSTKPTTIAGVIELIEYVNECEAGNPFLNEGGRLDAFLSNIAAALKSIA
jgi:hypothetical protein